MTKTKQNIILLQETPRDAFDISIKAGKMFLNRFCIDEVAGFELSGVYCFNESSTKDISKVYDGSMKVKRNKGYTYKGYTLLQRYRKGLLMNLVFRI